MRSTHVGRVCVQIVYKCSSSSNSSSRKNIRWRRCLAADMLTNMRAQNSVMQGCTRTTLILPHIAYSCACACVEYAHTPAYAECIRAYIAHNYYSTTSGGRAHSVHNCFTMAFFFAAEMFECVVVFVVLLWSVICASASVGCTQVSGKCMQVNCPKAKWIKLW